MRVGVRNRVKKPREPIARQKVATLKVETWNPLGGIFVVNAAFHRETPGLRPLLINRRVEPRNGLRGKRGNPDAAQRLSLRDLQVRGFPRGDAKLEFDEIDLLIDALCDEMLDLESRVDFHEEKAARGGVAEKLDSGCAFVVCLLRERERPGVELASLGVAEVKLGVRRGEESDAGRFFDELLIAALERTLALAQLHRVAVLVAEDLDLDVPRSREKPERKDASQTGYFSSRRCPSPKCFCASLRQLEIVSASWLELDRMRMP